MPSLLPTRSGRAADAVVMLLIVGGVALYLCLLPWGLQAADESYFLVEAKRLRDGEVMYRDIFEFVTPLATYAMATLFWLFGTTMATARIAMASLHGLTAALLYAAARGLSVRRTLAAAVPLIYVALCQAVWPYASWHWFSTFGAAALLCALVAGAWSQHPQRAIVPGLISGVAIGMQQQKGIVLAAGVGLVFAIDALLDYRYREHARWRLLIQRSAYFALGVALVIVPLLAVFVIVAGPAAVYDALIRFPLETYRANFHCAWASFSPHEAQFTFPRVLKYSPALLLLPLLRWMWNVARGRRRELVTQLTALIVLGAAAVLSTWYYPDLIHVAFIAGVFWVAAAEGVDWILSAVRPAILNRGAGGLALAGLCWALVPHMQHSGELLRQTFPVSYDTAFGRVDLTSEWEGALVETIRPLLDAAGTHDLYCYPHYLSLYLTADARNPTPYQYFAPAISPPAHTDRVLRTLEARRLPYIVACPFLFRPTDPVAQYIRANYAMLPMPDAPVGTYRLYGRKDLAAPAR